MHTVDVVRKSLSMFYLLHQFIAQQQNLLQTALHSIEIANFVDMVSENII